MRLFFLTFLLAATVPAMAEPTARRTCRIIFPERPEGAPKAGYLFDGKTSQAVTLPSMNFSEVIGLPSGDLTLFLTGEEIRDPEILPTGVPKLYIPEGVKDFYLLIVPDPAKTAFPLDMKLVDAGAKLKPGETLWFNLTNHRIAAKLGEGRMTVDPKSLTVSKDPLPASGYYRAELIYQAEGKGEFRRITEQSWWHDAASRHVGFVVNTGGMLPKIYFFRDFRSEEE
jgi:hypothetical protein